MKLAQFLFPIWKTVQHTDFCMKHQTRLCKGGCCSLSAQRFPLLIEAPQKVREGGRWRQRERQRYVGVPRAVQSAENTSVCHRHFTHSTVRSHNSYITLTAGLKNCFECDDPRSKAAPVCHSLWSSRGKLEQRLKERLASLLT